MKAESQLFNNTANDLYLSWQALREEQPKLRARDAAGRLGVSEAELVASRLGLNTIRLNPDWANLLPALGGLGRVMVLTRNEHCVHERKGVYREVTVTRTGKMGLVVSPDIDLRMFLSGWHSVFAITEDTAMGTQRSIQVFDAEGVAAHKVFLTSTSDLSTWDSLLSYFRQSEQTYFKPEVETVQTLAERPDHLVDVDALQQAWAGLKDTHHFFAMLQAQGVSRLQALRLVGRQWAEPLDVSALPTLFEAAAQTQVPIMVFVGNRHCIQIHSGPVHNLRWLGTWFNVLDPDFNLHLQTAGIYQVWRVRKPGDTGLVTSWEVFDQQGEVIVQLFGARKPGIPERRDWRELAEAAPALEQDA